MATDARLQTGFWVGAYRMRLEFQNIPVFVRHKGDENAGAVLVKLNTLDGSAQVFQRGFAFDGPRGWEVLAKGEDAVVEAAIAAGAGSAEVSRAVGRVAARYGISDWEALPATRAAIAAGYASRTSTLRKSES